MTETVYESITRGWPESDRSRFPAQLCHHSSETGSTNDDLIAMARAGRAEPFSLISTDFQTLGRGRRGDKWVATPGRNLLFSLALPLESDRSQWPRLPHLTAYLVGNAIESVLGPGLRLETKWPNDLLYCGKKIAGILVEIAVTPEPMAIVGVGVNVNLRSDELPPDLQATATSLYEMIGCESSRWFLLGLILQGFLRHYPSRIQQFEAVLEWIESRDSLRGKPLRIRSGLRWLEGIAAGIGIGGELLLDNLDGEREAIISAEKILPANGGTHYGNVRTSTDNAGN